MFILSELKRVIYLINEINLKFNNYYKIIITNKNV